MKASLKIIQCTERVFLLQYKVKNTMGSSSKINVKDMEFASKKPEKDMKANGFKTKNMEKEC